MPPKRTKSPPKSSPVSRSSRRRAAASPLKRKLTKCEEEKKAALKKARAARRQCGKSEARQTAANKYRENGSYVAFYKANFSSFYKEGMKVPEAAKAAGAAWRAMPVEERRKFQLS